MEQVNKYGIQFEYGNGSFLENPEMNSGLFTRGYLWIKYENIWYRCPIAGKALKIINEIKFDTSNQEEVLEKLLNIILSKINNYENNRRITS